MKNFGELLYGEDYARKSNLFNSKVEQIKEVYEGDFDTDSQLFVIIPNQNTRKVSFTVDKEVPPELSKALHQAFKEVWS